jgi:hypothetical protein
MVEDHDFSSEILTAQVLVRLSILALASGVCV